MQEEQESSEQVNSPCEPLLLWLLGLLLVTAFSIFFAGLWMNRRINENEDENDGSGTVDRKRWWISFGFTLKCVELDLCSVECDTMLIWN